MKKVLFIFIVCIFLVACSGGKQDVSQPSVSDDQPIKLPEVSNEPNF